MINENDLPDWVSGKKTTVADNINAQLAENRQTTEQKVLTWANGKGLLVPDSSIKQALKMCEEAGEVAGALLKGDAHGLKLEIGDVLVTLTVLCAQVDTNLSECFELAYEKISKRTGKTVDGIFRRD